MTTQQHSWKSIPLFVFTLTLSLFLFTNCLPIDDIIGEPQLTFSDEGDITFDKEGGTTTISLTSNRDWSVSKIGVCLKEQIPTG